MHDRKRAPEPSNGDHPLKRPDKEPKRCGKHPLAVAIWHVKGVGYCYGCRDEAYAAAAKESGGKSLARRGIAAYEAARVQRERRLEAGAH